jgi:hypothetical protein
MQTVIAQELAKTGHAIYVDASIKKLLSDIERGPGRPTVGVKQRPDISVWHKTVGTLRAAIEIKRAYNFAPIISDAKKNTELSCIKTLSEDRLYYCVFRS